MAIFFYKGRQKDGKTVTGSMESTSRGEVVKSLRRQGVFPIEIKHEDEKSKDISFKFSSKKVSVKDISIMCRQFHTIIAAGISVVECIDILKRQTENKTLTSALEDIYEDVQTGVTLSNAFKKFPKIFPELLVNMVAAGEVTGQLDEIMNRMADMYEKEHKINVKLKGALVYPKILISVSTIVVGVLLVVVLPGFITMFEGFGVELPAPTLILLGIGDFIKGYWWLIALVLGILFVFMQRSLNTAEGKLKYDDLKLKLPVLGKVNKQVATTRFARSLATMLNSGITIIEAMEMVSKVIGNHAVSKHIDDSMEKIKRGEGISGPLNETKLFPPMLISMIQIGEETGSLNSLLDTTANFYDDEIDYAIDTMISLINPLILLVMAVVVGFIVMAVALPMFDMYNHLNF